MVPGCTSPGRRGVLFPRAGPETPPMPADASLGSTIDLPRAVLEPPQSRLMLRAIAVRSCSYFSSPSCEVQQVSRRPSFLGVMITTLILTLQAPAESLPSQLNRTKVMPFILFLDCCKESASLVTPLLSKYLVASPTALKPSDMSAALTAKCTEPSSAVASTPS